jgi:RHS repeat-associated protein
VVAVYHKDGLDSIRAISDMTGQILATYETDEFGVSTETEGTTSQPFMYTGEQRDLESGFVYLRDRILDPSIGRMIQRDILHGIVEIPLSSNRYVYVENNPITFSDPSGHTGEDITIKKLLERIVRGKPHFAVGAVVSFAQAQRIRMRGGSVLVEGPIDVARKRIAQQIQAGAFPGQPMLHNPPHKASPIFRPHYQHQDDKYKGHVFYTINPALLDIPRAIKQAAYESDLRNYRYLDLYGVLVPNPWYSPSEWF